MEIVTGDEFGLNWRHAPGSGVFAAHLQLSHE